MTYLEPQIWTFTVKSLFKKPYLLEKPIEKLAGF